MGLRLTRHHDVESFLAAAGGFLVAREAEHNLLLGICSSLRSGPSPFGGEEPTFLSVRGDRAIVAATLRTPPWKQVLSELDDLKAVDLIVDALEGEALPGVIGPIVAGRRFALDWARRTGRPAAIATHERIYRLTQVVPSSREVPGAWRTAGSGDRELLLRWLVAFTQEALSDPPPIDPEVTVSSWLEERGRLMYFWVDEGRPVSMAGVGGETPNGNRIGPVYTPPELRGRGYATSLVAAVSQARLDAGRSHCFLFTDLANPTSNRIYQSIGYEPVTDVDHWRFG